MAKDPSYLIRLLRLFKPKNPFLFYQCMSDKRFRLFLFFFDQGSGKFISLLQQRGTFTISTREVESTRFRSLHFSKGPISIQINLFHSNKRQPLEKQQTVNNVLYEQSSKHTFINSCFQYSATGQVPKCVLFSIEYIQ